ncbi:MULTISPECIES: sodium:solute symporter family protein [Acetomicrobium]
MLYIVIFYMAVLLLIGWWVGKVYVKGMTDFLLAGRRLGIVLCAATLAATHFGGGAVMGGGEYGFRYGLSGAWYGVSCGIGLILLGLVTARKFRDLAFYTVPDYLEKRYGGKTIRALGSLLSIVALIGILAAQVLSARGALGILGITGNTGAILATFVFIIYTTAGGMWAVTLTDLIQMLLGAIGVIVAASVVLGHTGGFGGLESLLQAKAVGPEYLSIWGMGTASIMWLLVPTVMYTLIGQDFYQRLFSAKNGTTAKGAALVGGIVLVIVSFFPAIMGMGANALADLEDPSMAVPWILKNMMGPLLGGVILAALLAAIMSTADSLLSAATSHIVKDFWIEIFHASEADQERELLKISRISTFVIGILALVIALMVPGIIDALIYSYTMYTAGVFVPVIGGFLWKGATKAGALASLVVGSIVALWGIVGGVSLFGAPVEIFAALISLVVFVVVSLLTNK